MCWFCLYNGNTLIARLSKEGLFFCIRLLCFYPRLLWENVLTWRSASPKDVPNLVIKMVPAVVFITKSACLYGIAAGASSMLI